MENLKEYMPLIFIAIAFLISLIKGVSRKSGEDHNKTTLPKSSRSETNPQEKVIRRNPATAPSSKVSRKKNQPEKENNLQPQLLSSKSASINLMEDAPEDIDSKNESSPDEEHAFLNINDKDELKKAVIYSEILQRKYS